MGPRSVPSVWRVTLLGEMCFYAGNTDAAGGAPLSIPLPTQKTRLLLAYLLLHPKTAHSRERLADLFWPDSETERARRSLRGAISALNKAFANVPDGSPAPDLWIPDTQNLKLAPGLFTTDIAEWEVLRDEAEAESGTTRLTLLRRATTLYTGPLLPGFDDTNDDEPWLEPLRTHYASMHRAVLWEVSRSSAEAGNLLPALDFARRARDADDAEGFFDSQSADARHLNTLEAHITDAPPPSLVVTRPAPMPEIASADARVTSPIRAVTPGESSPPPPLKLAKPSFQPVPVERVLAEADSTTTATTPPGRANARTISPAAAVLSGAGVAAAAWGIATRRGGEAMPRPTSTPRPADPGNLWYDPNVKGSNTFNVPAAQGMEAEDYEASLGHLRKRLALAKTDEERAELADKIWGLGRSSHCRDKGQGGIALAAYEDALAVFRQLNRTSRVAEVQLDIADTALLLGQRTRAVRAVHDARRTLDTLRYDSLRIDPLTHLGELLTELGEYQDARRTLEQCLRLSNVPANRAQSLRYLGSIASDQGRYAEAEAQLTKSAALFQSIPDRETHAEVIATFADCRLRQGYLHGLLPLYEESLAVWQRGGQTFWVARMLARIARLRVYQKDTKTAAKEIDTALRLLENSNGPMGRALPLLIRGRLQIQNNYPDYAVLALREAVSLCRRVGHPRLLAETLEVYAIALYAVYRVSRARSYLREADTLRRQAEIPVPPIDRPAVDRLRQQLG